MAKNTVCDECPCFNHNSEYGSKCNLGYIIEISKEGYTSEVCELESILYGGKFEFRPTLRALDAAPAQAIEGEGNQAQRQ